ncbi:hypothetical protein A9R05_13265 [Burkholderia sp. KK1]|nr:hypothetical protein A9R05_13265 [Burkholderia sp. KK1]
MTAAGGQSRFGCLSRFAAYSCVGAAGTAAQYATLSTLVLMHACGTVLASGFGALVGAMINYILNYRLIFRATASHGETAPRFFAIAAAGIALNSLLMFALIHWLGAGWVAAQLATTACVLLLSYCANSRWTFRAHGM